MNILIDQRCFRSELVGWTWRGLVCAVPSAAWAVIAGFTQPAEIIAMVLIVGGYIVSFAFGTAWLVAHPTPERERFVWALKVAGAIKATALLGAVGWWSASVGFLPKVTHWSILLVWPDLCLGFGSIELIGFVARVREATEIGQQNSFALTALITLLQGAFLTALLALIALAVLAGQSARLWAIRRRSFPAPV